MKTKNLFLVTLITIFGFVIKSNGQATQATNAIASGSYLGTSNNNHVEFRRGNIHSGLISTKNTFFGYKAGTINPSSGSYQANSAFGVEALQNFSTSSSIKHNSAFGYRALKNNLSSSNSAFGFETMLSNVVGYNNIAIGLHSMRNSYGGQFNIALGSRTLSVINTGSRNIGLGHRTLEFTDTGNNNIGIGYYSLPNIKGSSNSNIALGYWSGTSMVSASNNIVIGAFSGQNLKTGSNNTFVGRVSVPNAPFTSLKAGNNTSNTIILANGKGSQGLYIHGGGDSGSGGAGTGTGAGNVGIGLGNNIIPQNKLEIAHGKKHNSGLRFRHLNSSSPASFVPNGKVLTVNANGDVVLTTDQGGIGSSTLITAGTNITVTGTGVPGDAYIINSTANNAINNIYENDGVINQTTTTVNNRRVDLNDRNIWFDTSTSNNNGKLYIGSQPSYPNITGNYNLFVEGGILTEKVKVALRSTTNWADYVFANDYKLMSLQNLESYILKNKHLPGIESADELVKNGMDLAEMQAKQMSKIEELTLYVIQQNKEIEELKRQVKALLER